MLRILSTKDLEFFTECMEFPTRGVRMRASSLASLYVGDPMGVPSLCTFGSPYICGGEEYLGVRKSHSLSSI